MFQLMENSFIEMELPASYDMWYEFKIENEEQENQGTLMLDATCAPVNIRYPQDVSLLNEAREKLEAILYPLKSRKSPMWLN